MAELIPGFVIASEPMERVAKIIRKIANYDTLVLINGESGTGKELVAYAIHELSKRRAKELVTVYCPDLTSEIINSELFGHEKGSFTGAIDMKMGMFEQADKGTVFIDEISELSFKDQGRLLRILEKGQIRRVGGRRDINIDIRVIAATNKNLEDMVRQGKFRSDLYFRLKRIDIYVPSLRSRVEEIPALVEYFLKEINAKTGTRRFFTAKAVEQMKRQRWPGNVRELKNTVERTVLLADSEEINDIFTFEEIIEPVSNEYGDIGLRAVEKKRIEDALARHMGYQKRAAEELNISPRVINYKIKTLGIDLDKFKFKVGMSSKAAEPAGAANQ